MPKFRKDKSNPHTPCPPGGLLFRRSRMLGKRRKRMGQIIKSAMVPVAEMIETLKMDKGFLEDLEKAAQEALGKNAKDLEGSMLEAIGKKQIKLPKVPLEELQGEG